MSLEQWNAMIESAEKEVAKEEPKKKINYIMRAETGDKQVHEGSYNSGRTELDHIQNEEQNNKPIEKKIIR